MGAPKTDPNAILEQDEDYRRLAEKHRRCKGRLQELQSRHHLIPEEEMEQSRLKKEKLALKDQMAVIAQRLDENRHLATG
ncbi:MAG: YdcH family protein [Acidobacteriota bacterium]